MAAASLAARERQAAALKRMLDLNRERDDAMGPWQEPWKVLVYDRLCKDIISPILRVGDLRERGITLYLLLDSERDPIPDVPAIYFVMPTQENVRLIGQDLSRRLYDAYHINFCSPVPRPLLEDLAQLALRADAVSQIAQVVDQHVSFVSLEADMVDLQIKDAFARLNDPAASDAKVEAAVDAIVTSVFSLVATLGAVPVIRCPKGGAAEMVATMLTQRVRDQLKAGSPFFSDSGSSVAFQRPVLILLERSTDLGPLLQHPWSYRALCHDLLGMRLNRLTCEEEAEEPSARGKSNTYNLEATDTFWGEHAGAAFPAVAEAVDTALQAYRTEIEAFGPGAVQAAADGTLDIDSQLNQSTQQLQSAMSALPALQERKRNIDMHTNIATALLHKIRNSSLDLFVGAEEAILGGRPSAQDKADVEKLIADGSQGAAADRLRLLCLYFLCCRPPAAELEPLVGAMHKQGVDMRPFGFIKEMVAFQSTVATSAPAPPANSGGVMNSVFKAVGGSAISLTSTLRANVKDLLPARREMSTTAVVSAIMDGRTLPQIERFLTMDPKLVQDGPVPEGAKRGPFRDAIVVMIGGGNYLEYQNLREHAQQSGGAKRVLYCATEMLSGAEFLAQLSKLSKPS